MDTDGFKPTPVSNVNQVEETYIISRKIPDPQGCPNCMVGRAGFEPAKHDASELQSGGFVHSPIYP